MLFPQALSIPVIPNTPEGHEAFVQQFLLAPHALSESARPTKTKSEHSDFVQHFLLAPQAQTEFAKPVNIDLNYSNLNAPTILICGHNTRDSRCGVLGPLLQAEFVRYVDEPVHRIGGLRLK